MIKKIFKFIGMITRYTVIKASKQNLIEYDERLKKLTEIEKRKLEEINK